MSDLFPGPPVFDIDPNLLSRNEHHFTDYAPYWLGTHSCLGCRLVELLLAINLMTIATVLCLRCSSPSST